MATSRGGGAKPVITSEMRNVKAGPSQPLEDGWSTDSSLFTGFFNQIVHSNTLP